MILIWRAVETASEIVTGIGMWERMPYMDDTRLGSEGDHWSFRRRFFVRKYVNFGRGGD